MVVKLTSAATKKKITGKNSPIFEILSASCPKLSVEVILSRPQTYQVGTSNFASSSSPSEIFCFASVISGSASFFAVSYSAFPSSNSCAFASNSLFASSREVRPLASVCLASVSCFSPSESVFCASKIWLSPSFIWFCACTSCASPSEIMASFCFIFSSASCNCFFAESI